MARVLTFLLAVVAALAGGCGSGIAQGQAWCLISSGPPTRCSFYTLEQCLESRAGGSSHCSPNPNYAGNRSEGGRTRRR